MLNADLVVISQSKTSADLQDFQLAISNSARSIPAGSVQLLPAAPQLLTGRAALMLPTRQVEL